MRKNLVICDDEIRYATRLGENISERENWEMKVYVCSSLEHALQISESICIDLFLVSEQYSYEERSQIEAGNVFVLVKGIEWNGSDSETPIFKYQSTGEIMQQVFDVYVQNVGVSDVRQIRKGTVKMIAVYSPIHRVGKTTFAMALGRELAETKKTLYLNFEEYAGMESHSGINMGDLLYYMKQGDRSFKLRLETAVQEKNGLSYLTPIAMAEDLKEITAEEWMGFLDEIVKTTIYERIILDLGESLHGLFQILERCDRVYLPILKDSVSEQKLRQFDRNVQKLQLKKLPQLLYRFVMPDNIEEYAKIRKKEEE